MRAVNLGTRPSVVASHWLLHLAVVVVACLTAPRYLPGEEIPQGAAADVSFHRQVRPILQAHCAGCHQPAKASGELDLTDFAALLSGGESGLPSVVAGQPAESYLIELMTPDEGGTAMMPQDASPLRDAQIDLIRRWIEQGARDDSPQQDEPNYSQENPPSYSLGPTLTSLEVSPDGKLIAVNGRHEVVLHSLDEVLASNDLSPPPMARLIGQSERIESIRFSPDGARLAVTGGSLARHGELQIWNVPQRELELSKFLTYDTLYGACWSPDGSVVSFGCTDSSVRAVDAATGDQVLYQSAHDDWALDTAFSLDGAHLISAGRDRTLKLIEFATERFIDNITSITPGALKGGIHAVRRHPSRDEVLVGGADGVPRIYRIHRDTKRVIGDDANLLWQFPPLPGRVFSLEFNRDGTRIAVASSLDGVGTIRVFAMDANPEITDEIRKLLHKPTHTRSAEEIEQLNSHFAANIRPLATVSVPTGGVYAVTLTPDGQRVISGGADGMVRIHDVESGSLLREFSPVPIEETKPSAGSEGPGQRFVSFRTDVMPLLAKLGCNAGTCHGAQQGKNGFALSLRGYDPLADHRALTDDLVGRRTNRARPPQSLMLLKATATVPHEGGQRITPDHKYYEIIRAWIAAGMPDDPQAPKVARIEISHQDPILEQAGDQLQLELTAHYTDGSRRIATQEAFFESSNTDVATVASEGEVTALRRGETAILARYEGAYAASTLTVMSDRDGFVWNAPPQYNYIDELVDAKLRHIKTLPSALAGDVEFLRRIYLDLTGLPPTADSVREFLADERPTREKRDEVVDELLASDEFVEHRTNKWADLLQVNSRFLGRVGAESLRDWIRSKVADNVPYDQFVREILTAEGSNRENPPAAYFKILRDPASLMENTTHFTLGVRFNCNKCHDHPFERWTQDQYYGLAAYFAEVQLQKDPESGDRKIAGTAVEAARPLYEIVSDSNQAEVTHERTGEVAKPSFPYEHGYECPEDASLREELAAWITSPQNRYFARSFVNRIWGYLLGTGLIEPLDDIRAGNPPTNPQLLDRLTADFIASGFDTRHLIRTICQSRTYQLSSRTNRWNEDDEINFSHAIPRRLPAEVLYDTIHTVVGANWRLPSVAPGTRASQLPDVQIKLPDLFLDQLGRPARESTCECERSDDVMLGSVMAMLNGPAVAEALVDPSNKLSQLEAETSDDQVLVEELFLRILNRPPTGLEFEAGLATLQTPIDEQALARERAAEVRRRVDERFPSWLNEQHIVDWQTQRPREITASGGTALTLLGDSSIVASGAIEKGKYVVVVDTFLPRISGLRLEVLADDRFPAKGPGRADNGNFVLSELRVSAAPLQDPAKIEKVDLRNADADHSQGDHEIEKAIDGDVKTGWAIGDQFGRNHTASFELRGKVGDASGTRLLIELDHQHDDGKHAIGRFRLSLSESDPPIRWQPQKLPVDIAAILRLPEAERSQRQQSVILEYHRSLDEDLAVANRAIDLVSNPRLVGLQDLAWALINTPAFLFNH